jgi:2-oxoisovalerate dehydrogenase E1 component
MPKSIIVNPEQVKKPGVLKSQDIPLNQYQPDIEKERGLYGSDILKQILADMCLIREFETCLNHIKTQGTYQGVTFSYKGPAHLSIGQESAAVGQALHLTKDDFIFGSHRSHGEVLAKCFSAAVKCSDNELEEIMNSYMGGRILKAVASEGKSDLKELVYDFILYGTMAEVFAKDSGFNRGMGGSMHVFFAPFGSMPNNAVVGGSSDISVGAALFRRVNRKPGIVVCNIGDAASGCGPTWEAMMLAAMDQYTTLWDKDLKGAPPILFNFFNNFYGMGGQTSGETMGFNVLARIGAGVNQHALHAERIFGYDPLAVADAVARKRPILEGGSGPVLLDVTTYRQSGHSPSDASSYRSKEELDLWKEHDCIQQYAHYLITHGVIDDSELQEQQSYAAHKLKRIFDLAIDENISPRMALSSEFVGEVMFSNKKIDKFDDRPPEVLIPQDENPRIVSNRRKSRVGVDTNGKPLSKAKVLSLRDALFESMLHRFYIDPTMIAFGEENRDWGGAFAVYRGLTEALPNHRLFNTSISEGAIAGAAAGYAMCGGRVVAELMYCDFLGRAGDEVFNQISKWQAMSAGMLTMPLVLRVSIGAKYGAQHSQDWTAMCAHIPGLKVMYPATPYDAKGMLNLALRGTDPVIFFESQKIYDVGELFVQTGVPEEYYEIEEGQPVQRDSGNDLTILSVGSTLYTSIEAANELRSKYGVTCDVIDARFIVPLNYERILDSVKKTGKIILISDACHRGSVLHTMASTITLTAFDDLDGPPVIVGSRNWITPAAEMESMFFPQKEWIIDAVHENILPLKGHTVTTQQTSEELLRRNKEGI